MSISWKFSWRTCFANRNIPMIQPEPQEGPHQSHVSNQIKAGFVKTLRYPGCRQLAECELVDDYREDRLLQARSRWLSGAVQSGTGCHCPVRHRSKWTRQNRCSNAANLAPSKRWLGVLSKIESFESQGNLPSLLSHIVLWYSLIHTECTFYPGKRTSQANSQTRSN